MGFSIAEVVCDGARRYPQAVALRQDRRCVSYGELARVSHGVAAHLAAIGVSIGDRVAIMMPNSIEWVQAYYGVQMAGAVPVPLNMLLAVPEVARILADAEPAAALGASRYGSVRPLAQAIEQLRDARGTVGDRGDEIDTALLIDLDTLPSLIVRAGEPIAELAFEPRIDRAPTDTAVILYTSGTTGQPKGVELSHFNVFWNAQLFARDLLRLTPEDRCLAVMPLAHVSGHTVAMTAGLFAGASVTLMERFDPASVLQTISRDRISCFLGVPAMFWSLLETPLPPGCDTTSLRACTSGGQALPADVHRGFEERFGAEIAEGYGLTEASPNITSNLFGRKKVGTVGQAVWAVEIRIVDEQDRALPVGERGQVIARGPGVMKGYFRQPEATAEALRGGWLRTGDIGWLDGEGYLSIVGRIKEIIASGGYKIHPREVEDALYEHPDVLEAAVVGCPDTRMGHVPVAFVAPKPGRTLDAQALKAWCAVRLSRYKLPRRFETLALLPKGATGKIDRLALQRASVTLPGDNA